MPICSKSIALLRWAKGFATQDAVINMYTSLVLPYFKYCSIVWSDGSRANIEKHFKMQKRAARIITGSNYEVRSRDVFESLDWEPIEQILKKREIITTFKALKREFPDYMTNMFKLRHNETYTPVGVMIVSFTWVNPILNLRKNIFHTEGRLLGTVSQMMLSAITKMFP